MVRIKKKFNVNKIKIGQIYKVETEYREKFLGIVAEIKPEISYFICRVNIDTINKKVDNVKLFALASQHITNLEYIGKIPNLINSSILKNNLENLETYMDYKICYELSKIIETN
ncbi:MAG: hypothetical protein K9K32_00155 [Halanaerobiales bacterium]|nr:hypothetical protein [Halanaerobiales bacterium]